MAQNLLSKRGMSPVDNNIKINIDPNLGIDATQMSAAVTNIQKNAGSLAEAGITGISYENGQLTITTPKDSDILMHKVLENVLNLPEIQEYFGEQLKNISYSVEPAGAITADSVITLSSMDQSGKVTTKKGTLSDFDLRELMKLLISTFGELRTADRERALNIL
ncbi:MAG: hypothetical protein ACLRFH_00645, partial [Opitutales bacterium]